MTAAEADRALDALAAEMSARRRARRSRGTLGGRRPMRPTFLCTLPTWRPCRHRRG